MPPSKKNATHSNSVMNWKKKDMKVLGEETMVNAKEKTLLQEKKPLTHPWERPKLYHEINEQPLIL